MKRLSLKVTKSSAGERLDRFIAGRGGISRGLSRRVLDAGGVFLDGRRCRTASRPVRDGQRVIVNLEEGGRGPASPRRLEKSRLLYVDNDLVAVDKPPGVPSQPTLTTDRGALPELVGELLGSEVFLVHRLDRETSGVTLLARTRAAATTLTEAFRQGAVEKTYLALCSHAPDPPEGRIDAPLGKDRTRPGRRAITLSGDPAATRYRALRIGPGGAALIEAKPETGRTHQIRVHLAHLGAPILGDARYGGPRLVGDMAIPRVMLHALRLEIAHPVTAASLVLEAPIPDDFASVERALVADVRNT